MSDSLLTTGIPSPDELAGCPGIPSNDRMRKGRVSVIECFQEIPCNPCESACAFGAISVGSPITSLPVLDAEKCEGCGKCVPRCPGLAIFIVDKSHGDGTAVVEFPYEFLPLPRKGDAVTAVSRRGVELCDAKVLSVRQDASYDRTAVVGILIPEEYADDARGMKIPDRDNGAARSEPARQPASNLRAGLSAAPRIGADDGPIDSPDDGVIDSPDDGDLLICRCREITKREIVGAITGGATTIDGIKRRSGACMGLCQGKTCERLVARILADKTGRDIADILPQKARMPVRPVQISTMRRAGGGVSGCDHIEVAITGDNRPGGGI